MRATPAGLILATLLFVPSVHAQTLDSFQAVHEGTDKVFPFVVTPDQADESRVIVFRNGLSEPFGLLVYDKNGTTIYERNGTRGLQTLPALAAGQYRFFVRGTGTFQVTPHVLDRETDTMMLVRDVDATLNQTTAWVLFPTRDWNVSIMGDLHIENFRLANTTVTFDAPVVIPAVESRPIVLTLTGEAGAAYSIRFEEADFPDPDAPATPSDDGLLGLPFPGVVAGLASLALVAALRRRRSA